MDSPFSDWAVTLFSPEKPHQRCVILFGVALFPIASGFALHRAATAALSQYMFFL
jgi:hypothetical protein